MKIDKFSKIYIAGHNGMVGKACWKALTNDGYTNLVGLSSKELDLKDQRAVADYISVENPDAIIDAAAKVGGILANKDYPYDFLMDNMLIQNNLIKAAHESDIKKFIFLGSSCIYPKFADQPLKEEYLLTDSLEETNQWYAIAKISGVKLIESLRLQFNRDYISLMPTNLFGQHDNFDFQTSHVMPALIRKFHNATINNDDSVNLWGSGSPLREFLHVDDLAQAIIFSLENKLPEGLYNIGSGFEISIMDLALLLKKISGFKGQVIWDSSKPNGTPRKIMDCSKILNLGWEPVCDMESMVKSTYDWYVNNESTVKKNKF